MSGTVSIVAYSVTLTKMHYLFFLIVGQPDVDMCVFTTYNKTHYTAQLLSKLLWHSYANTWRQHVTFDDRLIISYGKILTGFKKTPVSQP